jgi:hypothetical protein
MRSSFAVTGRLFTVSRQRILRISREISSLARRLLFLLAVNEDCGSPESVQPIPGLEHRDKLKPLHLRKLGAGVALPGGKALFPIGRADVPTQSRNETRGI